VVGGTLSGLQWLLPWTGPYTPFPHDATIDNCPASATVTATMGGAAGASYDVTLHFRGKVEYKAYTGGTNDGANWQVGGTTANGLGYNIYKLTISSPSQTFYLNRGTEGQTLHAIDYSKTIQIDAGATVTLFADAIDNGEVTDGNFATPSLSVSGVTDPAQPLRWPIHPNGCDRNRNALSPRARRNPA
jgi:hypothetical protein